jgi:Uncharacterized protein conserved in bacteria
MTLDNLIFTDSLPKLDLHGLDRETARVCINDFIKENKKLKNSFILIVHGIGSGVLKKTTFEVLKQSKLVKEYKLLNHNNGCTIVSI